MDPDPIHVQMIQGTCGVEHQGVGGGSLESP